MLNKIAIIANGNIKDLNFHKNLLEGIDKIICADGGSKYMKELGLIPDYIIGDLDSIDNSLIEYYQKQDKTKIIKDTNQDKTDLELALKLAESLDPKELIILGAIGDRIDHTYANILSLIFIEKNIKTRIIDEKNTIELVDSPLDIKGKKDEIISIIPLTDIYKLNYKGLKWNVSDLDTNIGWFGISNRLIEEKANISFLQGKLLLIRVRKN